MGKTFQVYLPKSKRTYACTHCRTQLAEHDDLISKSFQGSQGRAYLFNKVVNVGTGAAEERYLLTGLHAVADIYCESCKSTLGWKYEQAFESSQKYKEGKFIIELVHLIKDNGWDSDELLVAANQTTNYNNSDHLENTAHLSSGHQSHANGNESPHSPSALSPAIVFSFNFNNMFSKSFLAKNSSNVNRFKASNSMHFMRHAAANANSNTASKLER